MSMIGDNDLGEGTSGGSNQWSIHTRDSFNRFDETLSETILNYLSFSDKVLFESVSKLWSKLIYVKQKELQLFGNEEDSDTLQKLLRPIEVVDFNTGAANAANLKAVKKSGLKSILKKCVNIEVIYFNCYCDEEVLQILGEYCPKLKTFQIAIFGLNQKSLIDFGIRYGHQLERIELYASDFCSNYLKRFLDHCPNVKRFYTHNLEEYICEDKNFLPKIEELFLIDGSKMEVSTILKNKYKRQMKDLTITSSGFTPNDCKQFILNLSELENLRQLYLSIKTNNNIDISDENALTIDEEVIQLSKGCPKLKSFELSLEGKGLDVDRLLYCYDNFEFLETIELDVDDYQEQIQGSVQCFKLCKNLKILNLFIPSLKEEFFDKIDEIIPNLVEFAFNTETEITDRLLKSFSKLPKLKGFEIYRRQYFHKHITDGGVCLLIDSCKSLEVLRFSSRPNIGHKTIDSLISHVINNPKVVFHFYCGSAHDVEEEEIEQINHDHYLNIIPPTLGIYGNFW